jgi:hypothetical protein
VRAAAIDLLSDTGMDRMETLRVIEEDAGRASRHDKRVSERTKNPQ